MDEPKSKGQLETSLENPKIFAGLLVVFGTLIGIMGFVFYLSIADTESPAPTPISGGGVPFATLTPSQSTPPSSSTDTSTPSSANPSLALLPVQGDSGTLVTITGKNWSPNDTVIVQLDDPTGNQSVEPLFAMAQITNDGAFLASFILQTNAGWQNLNTVLVTAESSTTGQQVSAEFSIIVPNPNVSLTPGVTPSPNDQPTPPPDSSPTPTTEYIPSSGDWEAQYYGNADLVGSPILVRNESTLDFDWGDSAPTSTLPVDGFSARWIRTYTLEPAIYRFHLTADDGLRMWINEELLVNEWYAGPPREVIADYRVTQGGLQNVRLEYTDFAAKATFSFWWEKLGPLPDDNPSYYDWQSEYWSNPNLSGVPLISGHDFAINFNWGNGSPAAGLPNDNFSARWLRLVDFEPTNYRFYMTVSDGARLWIDGLLLIDEWHDGDKREITRDFIATGGSHLLRLEYYEGAGEAAISLRWEKTSAGTATPTPTATPIGHYPDWQGEYWSNTTLSGQPIIVRNDAFINFNWGSIAPDPALPADGFSARWSRSFTFENGLYRFTAQINDGLRFYVDGNLVLDQWSDTSQTKAHVLDLNLSGRHWLVVEYYEHAGNAVASFSWAQVTPTPTPTPTSTPTPTETPIPTATSTATTTSTPTSTSTPTNTPVPTNTLTPTPIPTNTPTLTLTPIPTDTATPLPTETPTALPTAIITPTP